MHKIIVSDASSLILFYEIGEFDLLKKIFKQILDYLKIPLKEYYTMSVKGESTPNSNLVYQFKSSKSEFTPLKE